jgi:predicted AlkP superfamily phosphohydrolase/phosphomutase
MSRSTAFRARPAAIAGLVVAAALVLGLSCSSGPEHPARVIVFGVDAADWGVMRNLLAEGKLPNFQRLIDEGATGISKTLLPLTKSPIIWTSIATGKVPEKHGIGGFVSVVANGDTVPYTGNARRVKAIWNILSEAGYRVGVVGWMVTWPAEEVNGYMVSDYVQYEQEHGIKVDRQTYPDDLFAEIDPLRVIPENVSDATIARFYPVSASPEEVKAAPWHKSYVKTIYATDETMRRITLHLAEKDVDFLAVYLNGVDSFGHAFWHYRTDVKESPLSEIIDKYYVWVDEVLGEFMDLVDDKTLLVVCSDHGFYGPRRRPDGGLMLGIYMHGENGIIGFMGKGVRKGGNILDADVLDITPTILYALGLEVGRDMDGHVLTDAFDPSFLRSNPVTFVSTYETEERQYGEPIKSPVDDKIKERLRTVGYMH